MKKQSQLIMGAAAMIAMLSSCSDGQKPIQAQAQGEGIKVQGVAAYGFAVPNGNVTITDANDSVLYQGITDSAGLYTATVNPQTLAFPLVVQVETDEVDLSAMLPEIPEGEIQVVVNVNPITDVAATDAEEFIAKNPAWTPEQLDSLFQAKVANILGEGLSYQDFASAPDFVAARVDGGADVQPCVADLVLHSISELAARDSVALADWMSKLDSNQAKILEQQKAFQAELAIQIETFHSDLELQQAQWAASVDSMRAAYEAIAPIVAATCSEMVQAQSDDMAQEIIRLEALKAEQPENSADIDSLIAVINDTREMLTTYACQVPDSLPVILPVDSSVVDSLLSAQCEEAKALQLTNLDAQKAAIEQQIAENPGAAAYMQPSLDGVNQIIADSQGLSCEG